MATEHLGLLLYRRPDLWILDVGFSVGFTYPQRWHKCLDHAALAQCKAQELLYLAEQEDGEHGLDLLWEKVVRFFSR